MRQLACNATFEGIGQLNGCRYLLHDRDAKFCPENIKHLHPHHRVSRSSLLWLEHDFEA